MQGTDEVDNEHYEREEDKEKDTRDKISIDESNNNNKKRKDKTFTFSDLPKKISDNQTRSLNGIILLVCLILSVLVALILRPMSMSETETMSTPEDLKISCPTKQPKDTNLFRGMLGLEDEYDLVVVGAGLSGAVIAERASSLLGLSSLVIDKREHIGGNCYDYIDNHGIRVSLYGVHIFHTKYPRVEDYVKKFSDWVPYTHKVLGQVRDEEGISKTVPIPPNIDTVNILFGTNITSETEMIDWLNERRPNLDREPMNGEEMSISRVGKDLYEKIFKTYTKKQWDKWPSELDASVLARLPYRTNRDARYFNDPFQALPSNGYTAMFDKMLLDNKDITVRLGVDYFNVKDRLPKHKQLVYTGPIDAFYSSQGLAKLEYRSIFWEKEYLEPESGYFQPAWVVNYPGGDVGWTRISEYKHSPNQPVGVTELPGTIIYKEYSTDEGDPYYPVPNPRNQELYAKYQSLAEKEPGVTFVGRLASYKYFNMDQAILNALELFDNLVDKGKLSSKEKNKSEI